MRSTATRLDRSLVAKDLDALPHEWDTRYELVGGILYMSRRPSHEHQQIIQRLAIKVGAAVLEAGGDAVPEPGVVWDDEGEDNVSPDYALLLRAAPPPPGQKLRVTPDVIAEVLSSGDENRRRDLEAKRDLYFRQGALEYWILDGASRSLTRLTRGARGWDEERLGPDDLLRTPLLPSWPGVRVAELFP
ncbi:MAG: Uma2 family endonuclease [Deltaproteobacteria bacterium]|nr:Uma2 family endonuclease [Deltaproteobacteria bacterium]